MGLRERFSPKPTISDQDVAGGLRWLTWEGTASMGFFSITTSGFLAAYALVLGCNNFQIGILAALPFITQPLQILVIPLVERFRRRKVITLASWIPAQLSWLLIALIPLLLDVPSSSAVALLLVTIGIRGVFVSVTNCSWNSWLRDLVPQQVLGSVFARRQMWANLAAMTFGLAAAFFVTYWEGHTTAGNEALGYTFPLLFGAVFLGLASPLFMSLIPEPLMQPSAEPQSSFFSTISIPFRDGNYRRLLSFLLLWGLALNMSIPFFAVYMLLRLGLPLSAVIGFSILSQAFNIIFLRLWGPLADRSGFKAILSVSVSLYLLVVLGWTFTTMPERYSLTIPLLVVLHILAGIASAGVTLATGTIGLKLAPKGQATAYLAAAGLATSLGAGLGPLLGGYLADFFSVRQLSLIFTWIGPIHSIELPTFSLIGFDFLFCITFILGLFTLSALVALREEGEVSREVVLDTLFAPMRHAVRPMSSVPGLNFLSQFPYSILRRVPVPGLDVALGVTAYQLADMAKTTTVAVMRGQKRVKRIAKALEKALTSVWGTAKDMQTHGSEVARQTARGTMHAKNYTDLDIAQLARSAVLGIASTFGRARVDPRDVLRGTGYGVVQGAGETGTDLAKAAVQAVETAREVAEQASLSEKEAAAYVAQGALEAAAAIGTEAVAQVMASLPEDVLPPDLEEQER
jgi:MFS family permease